MVRIVKHIANDGRVDFEFVGFELWDDFYTLTNILKTQMDAKVVEKLEGIYSRYWTFEINNIPFKLMYHEDTGYCLCPIKSSADDIIFMENLAHKMLPLVSKSL
ncbi:hypothetical protein RB620_27130 [Paenibacillus sp. LHD-117]|uniref:hypothetical protein n=1 Tax=Paenibacillus sp. LHD-117 TaxID=3071412 RepID=UPI0027E185E1|nr:hypothetical protein [Paenibacillus sp. LHD-117]MDQ6423109.1 hypothetical protein [Paenibacillus sp. LHD-117]